MFSIDEFNNVCSGWVRRALVAIAASTAVAIGYLAVVLILRDPIRARYDQWFGNETAHALMGVTLLPSVVLLISGVWLGERWAGGDMRLRCPHCQKMLTSMRHLLVSTRNCGYCGRQVLAEPEPEA